jgi:phosphoglycolate phosphatase-like HAD superfamily hydrolase
VISVTGRRVEAGPLCAEYRHRPWRHALGVLLDRPEEVRECAELCEAIYRRSAMKRLLVQEGIGMALDTLRGASVEIGAISREPHAVARAQVDSTGLDRFLTVLATTPDGEPFRALERIEQCRAFMEWPVERCAFVSHVARDLREAANAGYRCFGAAWPPADDALPGAVLAEPAEIARLIDWTTT